jgi:hypothetical protein
MICILLPSDLIPFGSGVSIYYGRIFGFDESLGIQLASKLEESMRNYYTVVKCIILVYYLHIKANEP